MDENLEGNSNPSPSFENIDNPSPYNNPEPQYNSQTPRKRSPKKFLYILGAVVVILILLNLVRFISSKGKSATPTPTPSISLETSSPTPTMEPSASPTESPTPTATPAPSKNPIDSATGLDRSKLSVAVQNGSGEAGVGSKATTFLKNLGYNVISTGNAGNFNFTNVTIQVKASQKAYLPLLNKDLSSNYSVGTTSSDLTATSSADALVIVGK